MVCEKTSMLKHLAVHEPGALSSEAWQSHVRECVACRKEWRSFATSLAVYRRLEQDDAARLSIAPSWESLSRRLREQQGVRRRASAATGPWLAGVVGLFLAGGIFSWGLWNDSGEAHRRPLALQQDALSIRMEDEAASEGVPVRAPITRVSASATGGYGMSLPEWRSANRNLLEPHSFAMGRPSGEVVILPFGHDHAAVPYAMPVTSAPGNLFHLEYPTGMAGSPVR